MMPSDEQRGYLERRILTLDRVQAPLAERDLRIQVQGMLAALEGRAGSATDAEMLIATFSTVLRDIPGFAVIAACADYVFGRAGDGHWRPTPADVRLHAQTHLGKIVREKRQIEAVLAAKVEPVLASPENRKAVADMVRGALPEIRGAGARAEAERSGVPFVEMPHRSPGEVLASIQSRASDPLPKLSDRTRKALGLITDQQTEDAA